MVNDYVVDIAYQAMSITLMLAAPMLIGALVIGILISLFQAVTQINEQTLSFIPKIVVIVAAMAIFSPWMIDRMTQFTEELIVSIPRVVAEK